MTGGAGMSPARAALVLGVFGLGPFIGFAAAAWFAPGIAPPAALQQAEILWGAIILAFMAGARWGFVLVQPEASIGRLMAFGLIPALSLAAPFLPVPLALILLAAGFVGLLAAELLPAARHEGPAWYPPLRVFLTLVALICLIATALA